MAHHGLPGCACACCGSCFPDEANTPARSRLWEGFPPRGESRRRKIVERRCSVRGFRGMIISAGALTWCAALVIALTRRGAFTHVAAASVAGVARLGRLRPAGGRASCLEHHGRLHIVAWRVVSLDSSSAAIGTRPLPCFLLLVGRSVA